ncbi:ABC transporter ATP-binding protein [Facklamia miroungae]|uniref:ABC-type quaternary amine transporter n=1 Tax=Facklamia miroungae TaxID=120956 RepID=A0A1G7QN93_9LACT|nr:ABC transporter ATP-binding protein [Facklamia miroungae]SDF99982.1 putative spermidine/putrescine transport system ATP-binding protein [Facklamia miroungae]
MSLVIDDLTVILNHKNILNAINLEVENGEYIALLGPSGSGKTTFLKTVAGLIEQAKGDIVLNHNSIMAKPSHLRHVSVVFQDLRLFPHYNVRDNIAFPLKLKKMTEKQIDERVKSLLNDVRLPDFENQPIQELSGGQQQRVAIARALAAEPQVLLLDEPFSGLDEPLRRQMGQLVHNLHKKNGLITILVTHDKREAVQFADRIAFLHNGDLIQVDSPKKLFNQPRDEYVGNFFGQLNSLTVIDESRKQWLEMDPNSKFKEYLGQKIFVRPIRVEVKPMRIDLDSSLILPAKLTHLVEYPEYVDLKFQLTNYSEQWNVNVLHQSTKDYKIGEDYWLYVNFEDIISF